MSTAELEKLLHRSDQLMAKLSGAGEHELAKQQIDISQKLAQKIAGHKAQKRRKKRGK